MHTQLIPYLYGVSLELLSLKEDSAILLLIKCYLLFDLLSLKADSITHVSILLELLSLKAHSTTFATPRFLCVFRDPTLITIITSFYIMVFNINWENFINLAIGSDQVHHSGELTCAAPQWMEQFARDYPLLT